MTIDRLLAGLSLILFALTAWVWFGTATPELPRGPLSAPPLAEAAAPSPAERDQLLRAIRDGRVREDPDRRVVRQALMIAARRVARLPCEKDLRGALRDAAAAFVAEIARTEGRQVEPVQVNGRRLDAAPVRDAEALGMVALALRDGALRLGDLPLRGADLPPPLRRVLASTPMSGGSGMFACRP